MKTKKERILFILAILGSLFFGAVSSAYAEGRSNLLVMGEDGDEDSVARDSRVFQRVLSTLSNQLYDRGFDVYDETAITLDQFAQDRVRRDKHELIDIARSLSHPPIDVVVLFRIYAGVIDKGYTNQVKVRTEGQLIQVKSGKLLGNFRVSSPAHHAAPANCYRECVLEVVGDSARILANDLGAILGEKLSATIDGGGADFEGRAGFEGEAAYARVADNSAAMDYKLIFDNFSAADVMEFTEYLVIFSGYKTHRPSYSSARRSEIWYQSSIGLAKLQRNLYKMLEHLDIKARIELSGNTFNIEQTVMNRTRKKPGNGVW